MVNKDEYKFISVDVIVIIKRCVTVLNERRSTWKC